MLLERPPAVDDDRADDDDDDNTDARFKKNAYLNIFLWNLILQ